MSEEQAQQFLYQMQILESFAASLDQKEEAIIAIIREAVASIDSIKEIQNKESPALIPIGHGTYVKAVMEGSQKVLLEVGAGVVVEKDHESAINHLEMRIKEMQVVLNETAAQKHQTMMRLEQLKQEMDNIIHAAKPSQH
jgi:prefoldin alpha subunit